MIRVAASSACAELGGQGQAVGVGHAGIEQDQRVGPAQAEGAPEGIQGRQPVAHSHRLHPPRPEPLLQDAAVGGVVVHDEHAQVAELGRWPGGDRLRAGRLPPEPRREGEGAAPARPAVHGDLPAHEVHQPGGDRQAQPGSTVPPRGRGVLLLEGPEDPLLPLGGDADAGVAHHEVKADLVLGRGAAGGLHAHDHLALFGELDGVAHQVEQDLAQPGGVADQGVGDVRIHLVDQLQPFLVGAQGKGVQCVTDRCPQGEVGVVQLELASLDL